MRGGLSPYWLITIQVLKRLMQKKVMHLKHDKFKLKLIKIWKCYSTGFGDFAITFLLKLGQHLKSQKSSEQVWRDISTSLIEMKHPCFQIKVFHIGFLSFPNRLKLILVSAWGPASNQAPHWQLSQQERPWCIWQMRSELRTGSMWASETGNNSSPEVPEQLRHMQILMKTRLKWWLD